MKDLQFLQVFLENILVFPSRAAFLVGSDSMYHTDVSLARLLSTGIEVLGLFRDVGILRSQPVGGVS